MSALVGTMGSRAVFPFPVGVYGGVFPYGVIILQVYIYIIDVIRRVHVRM